MHIKTHNLIIWAVMALSFAACSKDNDPIVPEEEENTETQQEWSLVFEDNFDGTAYDTQNWSSYQTQSWSSAWNRYVVPNDASLAEVSDGALHMRARWNDETDLPETGAIQSVGKYSFTYGKLEVRAKFTRSGKGAWPAIWLMPQNAVYNGWPDCGEIDVMERLNNDAFVYQVIHQSASPGQELKPAPSATKSIDLNEYNTYGIIKSENKIEFQVNGKTTFTHVKNAVNGTRWPYETDFYIILNYACADKGDSGVYFWPGSVTDTTGFPYEMAIDYVKVWQLKDVE
ncbi:glycoside hydrolase family 16 protein [Mangrovibacterium marinum]|uniref:Glycosyl hydrolase family 16 n=1 Tax=Mangrovibacterium marinum TaxID=1639118 RepID=A0A2T5BXX6_9BACT|nr:glycoside hydrolase family 16 protein [Mangrovibacterium marinum]PTN06294.1 glycosyl hydrolase family 16 [Mangrovibacterium marinum]